MILTEEHKRILPALYAQEEKGDSAKVYIKIFIHNSKWAWYVTEFDGKDTLFGLVVGQDIELGYFSLLELERIKKIGFRIEVDKNWEIKTIKEVKEEIYKM